jgi:hypothetical protein
MKVFFPAGELIDRYCIAKLKFERTQENLSEFDYYQKQIDGLDITMIQYQMQQLFNIHAEIWNLESLLKSGLEQHVSLEEIGRRAIQIRNRNNARIKIKNQIAEILSDPVREIKRHHISE